MKYYTILYIVPETAKFDLQNVPTYYFMCYIYDD